MLASPCGLFCMGPGRIHSRPFPCRIYFILNLGHFMRIFGSAGEMVTRVVWLPTWHQARLLCIQLGIDGREVAGVWEENAAISPGEDLLALYHLLLKTLRASERPGAQRHHDP